MVNGPKADYYPHGHDESVTHTHSRRTVANSVAYLLPYLTDPRYHILDVGCGPGSITIDLANYVPQGKVVGLDYSEEVLEQAKTLLKDVDCHNVSFVAGDIYNLPFPDATFDITHAHQVLQHIPDPIRAFKAMKRVTKKGGIVAVRESDLGSFTWYPEVPEIAEWWSMYEKIARANGGDPMAGRKLKAWALQAGFTTKDIKCSAGVWSFGTPEGQRFWGESWSKRVINSATIERAQALGYNEDDCKRYSQAWLRWAADERAYFCLSHGEIICTLPSN